MTTENLLDHVLGPSHVCREHIVLPTLVWTAKNIWTAHRTLVHGVYTSVFLNRTEYSKS
jgi:hypothetical protein